MSTSGLIPPSGSIFSVSPIALPGDEDEYSATVQKMLEAFQDVPGRVSQAGVKRLANRYKFEIFEDTVPNGHRLSLGGSIVLIDIDFSTKGAVSSVSVSLASSNTPSSEKASFMSNEVEPLAEAIVRETLARPRLDQFDEILSVLSRFDKLSSQSADCFRVVDEVANALFLIDENTKGLNGVPRFKSAYGVPLLNANGSLGVNLWYWSDDGVLSSISEASRQLAILDVRQLNDLSAYLGDSKRYTPLRYTKEWLIDPQEGTWSDPDPLPDARAHFVIRLVPPVLVTESYARKVDAVVQSGSGPQEKTKNQAASSITLMNERVAKTSLVVHMPDQATQTIEASCANLLTVPFVEISEIPINHPRDIPDILKSLRKFQVLRKLWTGIIKENAAQEGDDAGPGSAIEIGDEEDGREISFADAIQEYDLLQRIPQGVDPTKAITAVLNLAEAGADDVHILLQSGDIPGVNFTLSVLDDASIGLKADRLTLADDKLDTLSRTINKTEDLRFLLAGLRRALA